jgi:hypothetical protein
VTHIPQINARFTREMVRELVSHRRHAWWRHLLGYRVADMETALRELYSVVQARRGAEKKAARLRDQVKALLEHKTQQDAKVRRLLWEILWYRRKLGLPVRDEEPVGGRPAAELAEIERIDQRLEAQFRKYGIATTISHLHEE